MSALVAAALHLARPSMTEWADDASSHLSSLARPTDTAAAFVDGPAPLRVLLIGSGAAAGHGTTTHDLALTGALARALARATARGARVDAVVDTTMTVACLAAVLGRADLARYDAVVVCLGDVDALRGLSIREWRHRWSAALDIWRRRLVHPTPLLVIGASGIADEIGVGAVHGWLADRLAERFNAVLEELLRPLDRAHASLLPRAERLGGRPTADAYTLWGTQLAAELVPALIRGGTSEPATLEARRGVEQLGSSLGS